MQTEIQFEKSNQLPINFDQRLETTKHVSEIAKNFFDLVSCKCGQCDNPCGCVIAKNKLVRDD